MSERAAMRATPRTPRPFRPIGPAAAVAGPVHYIRRRRTWGEKTWYTMGILRSLPSPNPKDAVRFDLVDLSLFRHVAEAGSITHGAERAHLALAAASTRIRNMEQTLGAALFVRGRQGVALTQAGRALLQHARAILRQADRLREDLGGYAGGLAGQVRV